MRALTLLALVSLTACEQATEPRLAPPDGPAYDVVYSPNETATLEIEAAAHSLYDFNNCLAFVYPYYTANPNCLFTDITPDVASDANFPITYLYLMNDPPPAEQIPEIMISPTEAIAKLEEYKAIILDGYNDGFVSCRARFATHNIADEIIAGIGRLTPTITSVEIPQWILDGVFDTGVDPFADATTPEGAPCGPPPPPPPSPDPGAVLYSMWASNTSCKGTSSLHVSGSHGFFAGTVHTNGEIKITGSMHEFAGVVNFVCGSPPARKHVWYRPDSEQVPPAAPPAKYARAGFTCTTTVNGNLKLDSNGPWWVGGSRASKQLVDGVYCATGNIELASSGVTGNVTLVADGDISLTGSALVLRPFSRNVLAAGLGKHLTVSGANSAFWGTINAHQGTVHVAGNENVITGAIIGDRVHISGNQNKIFGGFVE